jgi:hypothetical protein
MFAQLTGDFAALTRFGERVSEMASPRTMRALNQAMAKEAIVQARDGFREERDPYGSPWARRFSPTETRFSASPKSSTAGTSFLSPTERLHDLEQLSRPPSSPSAPASMARATGAFKPRAERSAFPGAVGRGARRAFQERRDVLSQRRGLTTASDRPAEGSSIDHLDAGHEEARAKVFRRPIQKVAMRKRPKKLTESMLVRMTSQDRAKLQDLADESGLSASAYLRFMINERHRKVRVAPSPITVTGNADPAQIARLVHKELQRVLKAGA